MELAIDSKHSNGKRRVALRLIARSLVVFVFVLGFFCVAVYVFYSAHSMEDARDRLNLFNASLVSSIDPGEDEPDLVSKWRSEPTTVPLSHMAVQWYSIDGRLLKELGSVKIKSRFSPTDSFELQNEPHALILTTPALVRGKLMGFIKSGQSLNGFDRQLKRLSIGLSIGAMLSFLVSGAGVLWLTRQALMPLEEAHSRLQRFTNDASHELRSPLMAIQSNVGLVLKRSEKLEPVYRERLTTVQEAVRQMTALSDNLLMLASENSSSGAPISSKFETVDLAIVIEEILSLERARCDEKGITLNASLAQDAMVSGVRESLKRLFANIVSNAIVYTKANGAITISMQRDKSSVTTKITDTGIGIAKADQEQIFQRFWRAERARSFSSGGAGLGLSIVQKVAMQHGGTVLVASELGEGSTFTVLLPVKSERNSAWTSPSDI